MRTATLVLAFTIAAAAALAAVAPAAPAAPAPDDVLFSPDSAVVGFEAGLDADVEAAIARLGGVVTARHDGVRFMIVQVADPAAFVAAIVDEPGVRYAERDPLIVPEHEPNDQRYSAQWGMPAIRAPEAWDSVKGFGTVVAVLDTGTEWRHPDLALSTWLNIGEIPANRIDDDGNGYVDDIMGWDFNSNDNDPSPSGCSEHGTHVAGIVAATQDNVFGVTGVAPHAKVMPLRVLCGGNHLSAAALAVLYAAENGADVVTCSWYARYTLTAFEEAVTYAYNEKDVLFIKSAGNQYGGGVTYPGNLPEYMAVSSIDSDLELSSFSSVGTKVELAAPGGSVLSTTGGFGFSTYSGTSMAAPHVAGTAALVWSANPDLTNEDVRTILTSTAKDAGAPGRDSQYGFGILDAAAAVGAA